MSITVQLDDEDVIFVACSDAPHKSYFGKKADSGGAMRATKAVFFHA
jgi:hypothetical protein